MATNQDRAGDALNDVVTACALRVFKDSYRPHQTPNDGVEMGPGPGTYSFSASELRSYCSAVVKEVNKELGSVFGLTIPVKVQWKYGVMREAIWNDCLKQMNTGAALLARLGTAK